MAKLFALQGIKIHCYQIELLKRGILLMHLFFNISSSIHKKQPFACVLGIGNLKNFGNSTVKYL